MNSNVKADSRTFLVLSTAMLLAASVSITSTAYADEQFRAVTLKFFTETNQCRRLARNKESQ